MMPPNTDGSGRGPVSIVRQSTTITSGVAVTQKLVDASIAFGNILRRTYGPNGLDKMMYKSSGQTAVTSDGAKIVSELLVKHPAAKAFVSLAQSQENACGDGVTSTVIIASELMREAGRLMAKSVHPLKIVEGFQRAHAVTQEVIEKRSRPLKNHLEAVCQTAMSGRVSGDERDFLAKLLHDLLLSQTAPDYENIRMSKADEGSVFDSNWFKGCIIEKRLSLDRFPHVLESSKVMVLSCPLELEKPSREAEIEISTPEQFRAFSQQEKTLLQEKWEKVIKTGVKAVFTSGSCDKAISHKLADESILVVSDLDEDQLSDLAQVFDCDIIDHLDDVGPSDLGNMLKYERMRLQDEEGFKEKHYFYGSPSSNLATFIVGGNQGVSSEELIRTIYDALRSSCLAIDHDSVILGGGNLHIAAALEIRMKAEQQSGRERLGMEAFARALEAIPSTLLDNAGTNKLDGLLKLRSKHREDEDTAGIDEFGEVNNLTTVWDATEVTRQGISIATETSCALLRVDQVISARGD
tara:strand:- start:802 stop:2370 length:1569 start_codon:yes stop_codon:yes gene_type:complete